MLKQGGGQSTGELEAGQRGKDKAGPGGEKTANGEKAENKKSTG